MGLYVKENNKLTVLAGIKSSAMPIGAVIPFYNSISNDSWLLCDGRDTTGTDEELETKYPLLYEYLGNTNVLPDLRELVPVGAGKNSTHSIANHDVYTVGQFSDDQMEQHRHAPNGLTGGRIHDGRSDFLASMECEESISQRNTGNVVNGRTGTTTHGKQIGVYYYIKAGKYNGK